jgi:CRP/FNR family cyclic AMP-dependent transcriptional regulator
MPYLDLAELFEREKEILTFKQGETIFQLNDPGNVMYIVLEGEVNITRNGTVLETVPKGGIFGEMALIDHSLRSASAVAATDCKLTALDEHRFVFLIQGTPYFALHVMSVMSARLRRQTT